MLPTDVSLNDLRMQEEYGRIAVGCIYIILGVLGIICNGATVVMICSKRVFRLSAYTLMANVALADSIMMLITGIYCGIQVIWPETDPVVQAIRLPRYANVLSDESLVKILENLNSTQGDQISLASYAVSFADICSWTAGVMSYALLGLNRCIAICYYGTRAKSFNRVSVAVGGSIFTWLIGGIAAGVGTFPDALVGFREELWSISLNTLEGTRTTVFVVFILLLTLSAVAGQWICSILVLLKIRQVKQKIHSNKLNQNSANRFRKQARLTFQFFYPSLLCTIATVLYLAKPFMVSFAPAWVLIIFHLITLLNHMCNPFIYAYFNDRMKLSYKEMITCAAIRYKLKKRKNDNFFRHNQRHNVSRRSNGAGLKSNRMSARSVKSSGRDGIVRSSLQMQSRDFEQLCEFIMRVNPLYDSSEGWRESSDDEMSNEAFKSLEPIREVTMGSRDDRESKSIVLDLGRQTVEHWVKFAKKASI